jgi:cell division protein FtsX
LPYPFASLYLTALACIFTGYILLYKIFQKSFLDSFLNLSKMKQSISLATVSLAACMLFFISSCNSAEKKIYKSAAAMNSSTVAVVTIAVKRSYPDSATKLPPILAVTHKLVNYTKLKSMYDAHDSVWHAFELHNYVG